MNKTVLAAIAVFLIAATVLAFNPPPALVRHLAATDVTAKYAKRSFGILLSSLPASSVVSRDDGEWSFSAPDGSAEFLWKLSVNSGDGYAARVITPAAPFVDAGLDTTKLPEGMFRDGMLVVDLGSVPGAGDAVVRDSAEEAFADVIDAYRERFGYHFQLGHFGIELDGGNMVEWAGDPLNNALDLVFVLDPAPLLAAGVDADQVSGWVYGTVIVHAPENGRQVEVAKFLKPFDLQ